MSAALLKSEAPVRDDGPEHQAADVAVETVRQNPPLTKKRPRRRGPLERLERTWGLILAGPYIFGLLFFVAGPVVFTWVLSLCEWNGVTAPEFKGLGNWTRLLTDGLFWKASANTAYFVALSVPLGVVLSLLLAILVNQKLPGIKVFRTLYFLPVVTSFVAVSLVWTWFYDPNIGVLNYLISQTFKFVGLTPPEPVKWLNDPRTAMLAIIIMSVWKGLGYNMVIFLAALQEVPVSLNEAATLDGAGRFQRFLHVTLPTISPITFFVIVITLISGFQVFDQVYIMARDGRPADSTLTLVYYLYRNGFEYLQMGYATTIGTALFVIIFAVTLIQIWAQRVWVHHD
ncbi:MAG: sugar ABC transporter permease [Sumerlaeia bacterium]